MYGPPGLMPSDLAELVCRVGGAKKAARHLGVTLEALTAWERTEGAPQMALRLLWFCGPDGELALSEHIHRKLQLLSTERDALREQLRRARAMVDQRRAALGARVIALQVENAQLRQVCQQGFPSAELKAVSVRLLDLLSALEPGVATAKAGEGGGAGWMGTSANHESPHQGLNPVWSE